SVAARVSDLEAALKPVDNADTLQRIRIMRLEEPEPVDLAEKNSTPTYTLCSLQPNGALSLPILTISSHAFFPSHSATRQVRRNGLPLRSRYVSTSFRVIPTLRTSEYDARIERYAASRCRMHACVQQAALAPREITVRIRTSNHHRRFGH